MPSFQTGGAEVQLLSLVEGLDKRRFDVTVAAFYRGKQLDEKFGRVENADIVFLGKKHEFDFLFLKKLTGLARKKRFDIVQPFNVSARFFAFLIAKSAKIPYIITTERNADLVSSALGTRVYYYLEKYTNRFCTLLVANSRAGGRFSEKRGVRADKIKIIYNGIHPEKLELYNPRATLRALNVPEKTRIVTMVARLVDQKDPFTFLNAAALVAGRLDDVTFLLVGDGPLLGALKRRVKELKMQGRFIFAGDSPYVADILSQTHVFALTSKISEGCSNAIIEAMSFGVPVVATNVGGSAEIVSHGKTGYLIRPQQTEQLAARLTAILQDEALRKKFSETAKQTARHVFSLPAMVNAYEEIYHKLVLHDNKSNRDI